MSEDGLLGKIGGNDLQKMILFLFLGLVIAILVLGFHKSPQATAGTTHQAGTPSLPSSRTSSPDGGDYTEEENQF